MKLVDVEVNNVKIFRGVTDPIKHQQVIWDGIVKARVESERCWNTTYEARAGD